MDITSSLVRGTSAGGGGFCLTGAGEPPQPSSKMASAPPRTSATRMPTAMVLRRWTYARLDSTGFRAICSIGRALEYMVHAGKKKSRGLYLGCNEVVTLKCAKRMLLDIH